MTSAVHDIPAADTATASSIGGRVRVWDVPTRVFHWLFALSFAGAWLTAESDGLESLHLMLGYTFAGLIGFRLIWGMVGTKYARFGSFLYSPARVAGYLRSLPTRSPEHHLGHNPAGALAIFAMIVLAIAISVSGIATYQETGGEWLEDLHEGAANVMLAIVVIHIAGVVASSLLHRENLVAAMVTGWKRGEPAQGIRRPHRILGALLLAAVLGFWWAYQSGAADAYLPSPPAKSEQDRHHDDD